jgi:lysophospholipase L1-like esterase
MNFVRRRVLGWIRPGIVEVLDRVPEFRAAWAQQNAAALERDGPLWLVIGDSTAQGIGCSAYDMGYVGQVRSALEQQDGRTWRIVNVSRSGARTRAVIREQLPWLDRLDQVPDLITCSVGANDVIRPWATSVDRDMSELIARLPHGAVLANVPKGLHPGRTARLNALISREAPAHGVVIADVYTHTGPPWGAKLAADSFHPNDTGYHDWAVAIAEAIGVPAPPPLLLPPDPIPR